MARRHDQIDLGLIVVAGLAAETGVVMHVYLDEAVGPYRREGGKTARFLPNPTRPFTDSPHTDPYLLP